MIVYNKTVLEKEKAFASLVKTTRKSQTGKFLLSTVILLCGIGLLVYGYAYDTESYINIGYIFLVFSIVYYGFGLVSFLRVPKLVYKRNQDICDNGMTYNYTFKEQSFQVNASSLGKTTKFFYKYDDLKKVLEYEDCYEFRLADNQILFIYKTGFDSSRMEEFFIRTLEKHKKKIRKKV